MTYGHRVTDSVCAVVVTYFPDDDLASRLERVASQVAHVIVVDNGTATDPPRSLRDFFTRFSSELILNGDNLGIAAALNRGVARARDRGFRLALLLDQDTVALDSMSATLCGALYEHPAANEVAVVGSNYVESANGLRLIPENETLGRWVERTVVITSGSLMSIPIFERLGGFREDLFIDEVDTEYCLRARRRGFHVIITTAVTMQHTIGAAHDERRFLWRTVRPVNYSPTRWYYIARNTVVIAREHVGVEPRWVIANAYGHLKWLAKAILYEPGRLTKVSRAVRGVWDGIRERMGPAR